MSYKKYPKIKYFTKDKIVLYKKLQKEREKLTKKLNHFEDKISLEIENIINSNLTTKELKDIIQYIPRCASKVDLWEYIDEKEKGLKNE